MLWHQIWSLGEPMDGGAPSIESVVRAIHAHRFDLSTEKRLQEDVWGVLKKAFPLAEREYRLCLEDIPDFFIDGIVVECKVRHSGSKMSIFRQLQRYAKHESVKAVILASNVSMTLPAEAYGKRLVMASLSRGWM